ncbi:MAG: hypothetical protein VSS75_029420 [Candidatus Parabeggiatoa sp.]|nr:hypothetical protein [Candidatus Parabeggiatoa sp.]
MTTSPPNINTRNKIRAFPKKKVISQNFATRFSFQIHFVARFSFQIHFVAGFSFQIHERRNGGQAGGDIWG